MSANKLQVSCTSCGAAYLVVPERIGRKLRCAKCQTVFRPQSADPVPLPAAAAQAVPMQGVPVQSVPTNPQTATMPSNPAMTGPSPVTTAAPQTPAGHKRCPDCHQFIPLNQFDAHAKSHRGAMPDGQQKSYPSLPPEKRYQGSLEGIPKVYHHATCGASTQMPEEIIRTYLVDPFFYGYSSFCAGCGKHISGRQLVWTETGENLYAYTKRLQEPFSAFCKERMRVLGAFFIATLVLSLILGLLVFVGAWIFAGIGTALPVAGGVFVGCWLVIPFILLWMRGGL